LRQAEFPRACVNRIPAFAGLIASVRLGWFHDSNLHGLVDGCFRQRWFGIAIRVPEKRHNAISVCKSGISSSRNLDQSRQEATNSGRANGDRLPGVSEFARLQRISHTEAAHHGQNADGLPGCMRDQCGM
jgi:hypothetical protein